MEAHDQREAMETHSGPGHRNPEALQGVFGSFPTLMEAQFINCSISAPQKNEVPCHCLPRRSHVHQPVDPPLVNFFVFGDFILLMSCVPFAAYFLLLHIDNVKLF